MIRALEKITVYVESQAAAKAFWTGKLGFRVALEQPMGESTWLEVAAPEGDVTLILYPREAMRKQAPHLVAHPSLMFSTADAKALYADLEARGVKVERFQEMPWGTFFSFLDDEGQTYLVRQPGAMG
jgi:catechol 2,3-dioxygenase-like lactoylglutathione lyase family enzyme